MAKVKELKEPIPPDTAFIIWDKLTGEAVSAGLLLSQQGTSNFWQILSKDGYTGIDLEQFTNTRYLILDGRHYDENPDELFELPRVPRIDIK